MFFKAYMDDGENKIWNVIELDSEVAGRILRLVFSILAFYVGYVIAKERMQRKKKESENSKK